MTRSEIQRLRPDAPILAVRTMTGLINAPAHRAAARHPRHLFRPVALTLAAVGVYGLLTHLVARQIREIGVRLAWARGRSDVVDDIARTWCSGLGIGHRHRRRRRRLRVLEGLLFGCRPRTRKPRERRTDSGAGVTRGSSFCRARGVGGSAGRASRRIATSPLRG